MAFYLSRELGGHNQGDIGKAVGVQKTSSASSTYLRMKSRVAQERRLVRRAQKIGEALGKSKSVTPFDGLRSPGLGLGRFMTSQ